MKINFWTLNKTYHTDLSADEVSEIVSKSLTTKQFFFLFLNPINVGVATNNKFKYTTYRPMHIFPIVTRGEFEKDSNGAILNVSYRPSLNVLAIPLFLLTIFIIIMSADNVTFEGEQISLLTKTLFSVPALLIPNFLIVFFVMRNIDKEMLTLEKQLSLKTVGSGLTANTR